MPGSFFVNSDSSYLYSMNRIDRLAAILIQLQSKRLVKAQEIADKFDISLRTVYRDVKALEEGGVPVIGEAGSGYTLMEGYRLPPVMFSQEEATAMLTASKLVQSKTDAGIRKHFHTALDKIRAVLRYPEKDHLEGIDAHIAVMNHPAIQYQHREELWLQQILKAIARSEMIEIEYTSVEKNEKSNRRLEPVGIYYLGTHWHLIAWCYLRNDYRNFRTDRIGRMKATGEKTSQHHPPLQSFIEKMSRQEKKLTKVVIDIDPEVVKYLGEQKYYHGYIQEETVDDLIRMTFLSASLTGFARWLMLFGDHARIIEPLEMNTMITGIARAILEKQAVPAKYKKGE